MSKFGGSVLNATINMYAYATLKKSENRKIIFNAKDKGQVEVLDATDHLPIEGCKLPLHRGVYNHIVKKYNAGNPLPINLLTHCEAPVGSGLGASSTLTVAIVKAFDDFLGLSLGEYELAQMAFDIERIELGLSGGQQDQYAAAFGGFNFIDFKKNTQVIVNPLRIRNWITSELEASLVLYYTGTSRESANIIDEQMNLMERGDTAIFEKLHMIKKNAKVMKEHLLKGELPEVANFLDKGWREKKATASKVSNKKIDTIYTQAKSAGALGGKVSGAGGGGFMMILCDPASRMDVLNILRTQPGTIFSTTFCHSGATSWRIYDKKAAFKCSQNFLNNYQEEVESDLYLTEPA
jgi:D-glycero-alpha-D-manno-heptose-7-phosphate kinase